MDTARFTQEEVATRPRRYESTAPGSDRLTYNHWRTIDPEGAFLSAVLNVCLKFRRTPAAWKESRTILIYKKGDPQDPANYRPITLAAPLQNCTLAAWRPDYRNG